MPLEFVIIFELVTAWVTGSFGGKTMRKPAVLFFEGEEFNRVKRGEVLMKIHWGNQMATAFYTQEGTPWNFNIDTENELAVWLYILIYLAVQFAGEKQLAVDVRLLIERSWSSESRVIPGTPNNGTPFW